MINFINCSFEEGVIVQSNSTTEITASNCHFEKSCVLGSSIENCEYKRDGTLIIKSSQNVEVFKFNNIKIKGTVRSIDMKESVIYIEPSESINIKSPAFFGISLVNSKLFLRGSKSLKINFKDRSGTLLLRNSMFIINCSNNLKMTIVKDFGIFNAKVSLKNQIDSYLLFQIFDLNNGCSTVLIDQTGFNILGNANKKYLTLLKVETTL